MWVVDYIKDFFNPAAMKLKALVIYPNKAVKIKTINAKDMRFKLADRVYIVDEKAIYFHKKKPMLVYHFDNASPLMFSSIGIEPSMKPNDINSILESKIVRDLLTATTGNDFVLYAAIAAAVLALVNTLIAFGVIKVG